MKMQRNSASNAKMLLSYREKERDPLRNIMYLITEQNDTVKRYSKFFMDLLEGGRMMILK